MGASLTVDELKKLSEDIIRLKVLDEADGDEKRRFEDEMRRLSDELIRLKTQDEVKSKFEETEKVEMNKQMNDAEIRIKTLEESKAESKALLHELNLKVAEEKSKHLTKNLLNMNQCLKSCRILKSEVKQNSKI